MKKILSVLLCAVLALGIIPFSAHAEGAGSGTISVDMVWDELTFVYAPSYPGEWDVDTLTYKNAPIGGWKVSDDMNNITITNNSAKNINVAFSFVPAENSGVSIDFYKSSDMKNTISGSTLEVGSKETFKVIPTGSLPESATSTVKIGTIKVSLSVVNS